MTKFYDKPPPNTLKKKNLVCSPHISIEPTITQSLVIEVEEKYYRSSVSMVR